MNAKMSPGFYVIRCQQGDDWDNWLKVIQTIPSDHLQGCLR